MMNALSTFARAWWEWIAPMSVQVAVLALIVAALEASLRRWLSPRWCAALWLLVLLKLLLPPWISSPVSVARVLPESVSRPAAVDVAHPSPMPVALFACWLAVCTSLLVLLFWRERRVRRHWTDAPARPAPDWLEPLLREAAAVVGLRRAPRVHLDARQRGPAVIGLFCPVVVLPEALATEPHRRRLWHVLLHEFAHLRRRDPLWSRCCLVVQIAYWFHPVAWLVRRKLEGLREACCDAAVARLLGGATEEYRRTLLELARPQYERPLAAVAFLHRHSQLLARLEWLEQPLRRPLAQQSALATLCALLAACCIPLGTAAVVPPPAGVVEPSSADLNPAGCLQLRFAVYRLLAEEQAASGLLASSSSP